MKQHDETLIICDNMPLNCATLCNTLCYVMHCATLCMRQHDATLIIGGWQQHRDPSLESSARDQHCDRSWHIFYQLLGGRVLQAQIQLQICINNIDRNAGTNTVTNTDTTTHTTTHTNTNLLTNIENVIDSRLICWLMLSANPQQAMYQKFSSIVLCLMKTHSRARVITK